MDDRIQKMTKQINRVLLYVHVFTLFISFKTGNIKKNQFYYLIFWAGGGLMCCIFLIRFIQCSKKPTITQHSSRTLDEKQFQGSTLQCFAAIIMYSVNISNKIDYKCILHIGIQPKKNINQTSEQILSNALSLHNFGLDTARNQS